MYLGQYGNSLCLINLFGNVIAGRTKQCQTLERCVILVQKHSNKIQLDFGIQNLQLCEKI